MSKQTPPSPSSFLNTTLTIPGQQHNSIHKALKPSDELRPIPTIPSAILLHLLTTHPDHSHAPTRALDDLYLLSKISKIGDPTSFSVLTSTPKDSIPITLLHANAEHDTPSVVLFAAEGDRASMSRDTWLEGGLREDILRASDVDVTLRPRGRRKGVTHRVHRVSGGGGREDGNVGWLVNRAKMMSELFEKAVRETETWKEWKEMWQRKGEGRKEDEWSWKGVCERWRFGRREMVGVGRWTIKVRLFGMGR